MTTTNTWTPMPATDRNNVVLQPGDVLRYNLYGSKLRDLRDGYLREGQPERRAIKKQWHQDALDQRFICVETGHNGYSLGIKCTIVGSAGTYDCIAGNLEKA